MEDRNKYLGIKIIGWGVIAANALLAVIVYGLPRLTAASLHPKIIELTSIVAVFPADFFYTYLNEAWLAHMCWMVVMTLSAQGILLFHRFGRMVFITLNIVHAVILGYIVLLKFGSHGFLDYFFKLYFNLVAVGTYVGFVTIREVRIQYDPKAEDKKKQVWFHRPRIRQPHPKDANGFFNLGIAYNQLERYNDAINAFLKSIEINPGNANSYYNLGLTYYKKKDYDLAVGAFKEAVRLDPIHGKAYFHQGITYNRQGCNSEAIESFKKALNARPDNAEVYKELGSTYMSLSKYKEAMDAYQNAVRLDPKDNDVHCQIGIIYLRKFEKYREAREVLMRAVRLKPTFTEAHFQLGMTCLKLNRHKDAIRSFKEVLRLDKRHKQAHYQLGFTYAMIRDFDSARREYRYLKRIDADLADTLSMLIK